MSSSESNSGFATIPEGYIAIAISEEQKASVLKISVLVRLKPDPAGGHLVVLRDTCDAKVFLGCIVDTSCQVLEWLELWIQNTNTVITTSSVACQSLSNTILDNRWHLQSQAFQHLEGAAIVKAGWESEHPLPTFLDISKRSPIHPIESSSGTHWKLCTDEGLLQQRELPGYAGSLHRYLYVPALGEDSQFVPVTLGAPTNASTQPFSEISDNPAHMIPLNPGAGLILVKKHFPIGLETFADILSGAAWDGLKHGRAELKLNEQLNALKKNETVFNIDGRLFLETRSQYSRLVETFHLKIRLTADVVSSVHSMVYHLKRPLLNISPDNWQVKLGEPGRGLPFLWTARAVLSDPGDAIPLAIERSDIQYYLPAMEGGTSIYRPLITSLPTKGQASARIRQVLPGKSDITTIEGTFATQERIDLTRNDLVGFRLNLACGEVNLYAHLEADSAMAPGEWRFRTIAQNMDDTKVADLRAAEGVPIPKVMFEVIPLLSSPCDLYSLAVIAIRILLVDNTNSLPVLLDEILSLARQIETDYNESTSLETSIRDIFSKDNRWLETLGPHHLTYDKITSDEAFNSIPCELWWAALSIILRMFPGSGRETECKDYGHAQQGGLHKVFERTIADLDNLILRTRNLIVTNKQSNQEISAVIQRYLT
ncbi:MAG: hypothetical protein ACYS3N_01105 [Planctomycetota bacterium]